MRIHGHTPVQVLLDAPARKVTLSTSIGQFTILPGHADVALRLEPGISTVFGVEDETCHLAHSAGTLVKTGGLVRFSVYDGLVADTLEAMEQRYRALEAEKEASEARSGAAGTQLELGIIRKMIELQRRRGDD